MCGPSLLFGQQSCLMLADLAASESSKRTDARYQRLEECKFTNLSMSALGNCVAALAKVCVPCTLRLIPMKINSKSPTKQPTIMMSVGVLLRHAKYERAKLACCAYLKEECLRVRVLPGAHIRHKYKHCLTGARTNYFPPAPRFRGRHIFLIETASSLDYYSKAWEAIPGRH